MKKLFGRDKSKTKVVPSDIGTGAPDSYFPNAHASQLHERSRSGTPQPSEEHWHVIESDAQSYSVRSTVSASYSPPLASSTTPSHASAPRALASLAPSPITHKLAHKDRERDPQILRKKVPNSHGHGGALAAVGILRALDPQLESHSASDPMIIEDNMTEVSSREDKKERRGFWERKDKDKEREKEKEREREREREREQERERGRLREQDREREKDRGRERERKDEDTPDELTRMIGYLTATSSEDWSLVLEVCERASSSESSAKEAVKALRREFKYAEPSAQLSAARLWAIMLRNSSPIFTHQCASRKFLDTLEDVISSSRTSPVVKERLLEVLAAAAYASSPGSKEAAFRPLWKKVKPADKPDDGVPMDTSDAMFSPPTPRHMNHKPHQPSDAPPSSPRPTLPHKTRTSSRNQVIPPEEDMRRLFQECKVGRGNASLLSEALAFARPEDLKLKEIIREFYARCRASQELIAAQIPWAFAQAEKSRQAAGRRGQPNGFLRPSLDSRGRRRTDSQVSLSTISSSGELTQEEQLLAALLAANEDLMEALRLYDDLERVGIEREAEERSRKETRMDRNHLRYEDVDHSYLEPGETQHAGSSSRSPSPSSPSLSSAPSFVITGASPAQQTHSHTHPLPPIPSPIATPTAKHHQAPPIATQGSIQSLAPPPHAPHGPRSPVHSNAPTSRTPSPERASLRHSQPRASLDSVPGALARDMSKLGIESKDHTENHEPETPIRPSAKALGKRRQLDPPESERGFDPDDIFYDHADDQSRHNNDDTLDSDSDEARHDPWHQPVHYVYDAAAERMKERLRAGRVSTAALVGGVH